MGKITFAHNIASNGLDAHIPNEVFSRLPQEIFHAIVDEITKQFIEKHGQEIFGMLSMEEIRSYVSVNVGDKISDNVVEFVAEKLKK